MARLFNLTLRQVVFLLFAFTNLCSASFWPWVTGPPSSTVDDSKSEVTCPAGYFVSECSCVDETTCDGSQVLSGNVNYCFAGHRYGISRPTRVIAKCESVNGLSVVAISNHKYEGEYVHCPNGYTMESCSKRDPWSQYRATYFLKTGTTCAWRKNGGHENRYIHISVVCVKRVVAVHSGPGHLGGGPSRVIGVHMQKK